MKTRKALRNPRSQTRKNVPGNHVIIHICGASGSGKTTLGNQLKSHFKDKIVVKDLDELLDEHYTAYFGKDSSHTLGDIKEHAYQEYIDSFIKKQTKPIIFVGLNDNFIDFYPKRKDMYFNVHAQHKYYIDIDDTIIVKQKCARYLDNVKEHMNDIVSNKKFMEQLLKAINTECNAKYILKWINKWKKDYKKQGYKFMSREEIYKSAVKVLKAV